MDLVLAGSRQAALFATCAVFAFRTVSISFSLLIFLVLPHPYVVLFIRSIVLVADNVGCSLSPVALSRSSWMGRQVEFVTD